MHRYISIEPLRISSKKFEPRVCHDQMEHFNYIKYATIQLSLFSESHGQFKKRINNSEYIKQPEAELHRNRTGIIFDRVYINEKRLQHLSVSCLKYKNELHYHHHRLFVDSWHKLLYCEISKGGCSTIKAVWMELNESDEKNLTYVKKTENSRFAHRIRNNSGTSLIVSQKWPKGYENYTKFIVVRHPMDRLVSAYYNLVNFTKGMADHTPNVVQYFKKSKHIKELNQKTLSFDQFLGEIVQKSGIYQDRHWNPISETCSICMVKYDYFFRLETIFDDFQPIASILGHPHFELRNYGALNGNDKRRIRVTDKKGLNWYKHLPEYQNVSKEVMRQVFERYQYDLKLFGYHFNTSTFIASCSVVHDGETALC